MKQYCISSFLSGFVCSEGCLIFILHVVANTGSVGQQPVPFYGAACHCVAISQVVDHSSVHRCLDCVQFVALMTKAAVKILIHFFGWVYIIISFGSMPRSEISESQGR